MQFDVQSLPERDVYRILVNTVLPRPIALVTSLDAQARTNTAPFSFFNVMGSDPPIIALGVEGDANAADGLKGTARNILKSKDFVINLVDEKMCSAMNVCGLAFPEGVEEHQFAGLSLAPSVKVAPPRVHESPVQFECRLHTHIAVGPRRNVFVGEILFMHVRDDIIDAQGRVDIEKLDVIGRLHGSDWYVHTTGGFQVARPPELSVRK